MSILATGATEYIMEKFSTSEAVRLLKTGEFTYFPRRADHVPLSAAGDARRGECALPEFAALRFRRRHHAGDAQSRIRKPSRRSSARRLRHHRDLDHGDDELAERQSRHGLLRHSGAGARGAHRRSERPRRRAGAGGRADRARSQRHAGLSQQAGRDAKGVAQRLVSHRRSWRSPTRTAFSPSPAGSRN